MDRSHVHALIHVAAHRHGFAPRGRTRQARRRTTRRYVAWIADEVQSMLASGASESCAAEYIRDTFARVTVGERGVW